MICIKSFAHEVGGRDKARVPGRRPLLTKPRNAEISGLSQGAAKAGNGEISLGRREIVVERSPQLATVLEWKSGER